MDRRMFATVISHIVATGQRKGVIREGMSGASFAARLPVVDRDPAPRHAARQRPGLPDLNSPPVSDYLPDVSPPPRSPPRPRSPNARPFPARAPCGRALFWRAHGFPRSHIASQYFVKVNKPLPDCRLAHGPSWDGGGAGSRQVRDKVSSEKGMSGPPSPRDSPLIGPRRRATPLANAPVSPIPSWLPQSLVHLPDPVRAPVPQFLSPIPQFVLPTPDMPFTCPHAPVPRRIFLPHARTSLPARPAGALSLRRAHGFPGSHGPEPSCRVR
jgi:hypothetical protein